MIKEALEYIVGLSRPELVEKNGSVWSDRRLSRVSWNPKSQPIEMSTLTSLLDYLKAGVDGMAEKMLVQVASPVSVRVLSMLDMDRKRECLAEVSASVPEFPYGRYMDQESFIIALQAKFLPGDDRELLLKFAGTVRNESIAEYGDDGVTQKAKVKTGISTVGDAIVPNPVRLAPFRTFTEVRQPGSAFVFRMRQASGVECAIFEADGGAWRNEAMAGIKAYLQDGLKGLPRYTVIS